MTPILTRPIVWLSALAASGSVCAGQERAAVGVLTPHFEVISTLEDGPTIEAARYLETLDRRFRALGFRPALLPSPRVRVLLLSGIKDVTPHDAATEGAPRHSGLFVPGIDRGWIISASNTPVTGDPFSRTNMSIGFSPEQSCRNGSARALPSTCRE